MGMEQTVSFAGNTVPAYTAVRDLLGRHGFPVQPRMIDGQLALPDESPAEDWRELRLGTPQGMVTVRRDAARVVLVTWGNADAALREAWNALAWAFAEAGGGRVESADGPLDAAAYRGRAELPAALRGGAV
jgi:hypothetical protein